MTVVALARSHKTRINFISGMRNGLRPALGGRWLETKIKTDMRVQDPATRLRPDRPLASFAGMSSLPPATGTKWSVLAPNMAAPGN